MSDNNDVVARLTADNQALQQRIAELEQSLDTIMHELEQSRSLIRGILDDAPVAMAATDLHGRYLMMNRYMRQMFGVTEEQVIQQNYRDIVPPALLPMLDPAFHQVQSRDLMQIDEYPVTLPGGTGYVQTIMYPVHDANDCPLGVGILSVDITERKRMQVDLQMAKFSLDRAVDTVLWGTLDGRIIYANEAASRDLGYTPDELLTMSIPDIDVYTPPERLQQTMATLKQQGAVRFEAQHRRKDGTVFPVEVTTNYLVFDGHEYLFAFAQDITERKRYENELRVFKMIIDNSPDGIGLSDAAGKITYSNPAHRRMFGYGDEIIGMDMTVTLAPEGYAIMERALQVIMAEGSWIGESLNQRKDGTQFPVDVAIFALHDTQGQMQGMAGILRDMSDRKQAEQERLALQERIIDAQREALREISTPIIPIAKDVVIMPLIGAVDSQRAQMVMETLIEGVARHQADMVILDITGVSLVDTQVANALITAAHAVRLLGARVMLTGIQPQIAQTLVHLGVDLSGIVTRGSLQQGIADALGQRV